MERPGKGVFITQTTQPCSWAVLNEAGKDLTINKSEEDDNARLLLALYDSLNGLYEKLSRLSYVMGKNIVEHNLSQKDK
jgi:hypothetical protein